MLIGLAVGWIFAGLAIEGGLMLTVSGYLNSEELKLLAARGLINIRRLIQWDEESQGA